MEERELSISLSVPLSLYTSLYLTLTSAPATHYTATKQLIKNIIKELSSSSSSCIRTIQSEFGYAMERKTVLQCKTHKYLYDNANSKLTLLLDVCNKRSIEESVRLELTQIEKYTHILRDFVYVRDNGVRIAIERHYKDYNDTDTYQMKYDCFNRYNYECFIHIEWEYKDDTKPIVELLDTFMGYVCRDDIINQLFTIMTNKNLNSISDEIINILNMNLLHQYSYSSVENLKSQAMQFYTLKYDGIRKNFCIYGKYIQIGRHTLMFQHHCFGQIIIGHCECMPSGRIILIDIYVIAENFSKLTKNLNISYTGALQNYHKFYMDTMKSNKIKNKNGGVVPKTQDEYFHSQRLKNAVDFLEPLEAVTCIQLLGKVWTKEIRLGEIIELQAFYKNLSGLQKAIQRCDIPIDGFLGFTSTSICKMKQDVTIDLILRFDEMFRSVYKRMKSHQHELKKLIKYINIQKTFDWIAFEEKFPGNFAKFSIEFLYFAHNCNFYKHYNDWQIDIDIKHFVELLDKQNATGFILLLEFSIEQTGKRLVFTRLRDDKCSANSIHIFNEILSNIVCL